MKEQEIKSKKVSFEQAIEQLENIVQTLEDGNISLDESLQLFEEGVSLIGYCQKKLALAEQKVSVLVQKNEDFFLETYTDEEFKK